MIRVTCAECRHAREYPDHFAGQELPCRSCRATVAVGGPDAVRSDDAPEPGPVRRFAGAYLAAVFLFPAILSLAYFWLHPRRGARPVASLGGDWVFLAAVVGLFVCGPLGAMCWKWGSRRRATG